MTSSHTTLGSVTSIGPHDENGWKYVSKRKFNYLFLWGFFTPVLADGISQEFKWQQVFSSFQDSPK